MSMFSILGIVLIRSVPDFIHMKSGTSKIYCLLNSPAALSFVPEYRLSNNDEPSTE